MKKHLLSVVTLALITLAVAPANSVNGQTTRQDPSADLNGDGVVTLSEIRRHNHDQRGKEDTRIDRLRNENLDKD